MPAIIKTHQRIINIHPKPPRGPKPKFIILFIELLLSKGDDHPPHIIFIIGIQPPLPAGNAAEVSQPERRLPITIWICSSPSSPCVCIIIAFIAACESPAICPIKYSPRTPNCSSLKFSQASSFVWSLLQSSLPSFSSRAVCSTTSSQSAEELENPPII